MRGLAVDALIEGIEGHLYDPDVFFATLTRVAAGEWLKFNRLGDNLLTVVQASALHAGVISKALQRWLPHVDWQQNNAFRVLEVLLEAQAVTKQPLSVEAIHALQGIGGNGKAAKIARQIMAV